MSMSEVEQARNTLVRAAIGALQTQEQEPPELLYHFTDAAGLIGIVESNAIWLSLATSLNDRSEVTYGLQLAQDVLNQSSARESSFGTTLRDFLSGKRLLAGDTIRLLPFVASLCEQPESSSHWLHYGRSGTGFAVAMGSEHLPVDRNVELRRIMYDEGEQRAAIREIIEIMWETFERLRLPPYVAGMVGAEQLATEAIRAISMRMKSPAFAGEREWRLMTMGSSVFVDSAPFGGKNFPMRYRAVGSRITPYLVARYDPLPLRGIIVGASAQIDADDDGLQLLVSRCGFRGISFKKSHVSVRP
jgi:hypothetical protein